MEKTIELGKVQDSKPQNEVKEQEINSPKQLEPVSKLTKKSIEYKTKKVDSTVPINANRLVRNHFITILALDNIHSNSAKIVYFFYSKRLAWSNKVD